MKIEHLSVLATVVVAFAASTALILNGQSELRRDMWAGQAEIRKDMRAGQSELRKDMRAGQAELRKDMRAGQAELRKDMRAGQAELSERIETGQAELNKRIEAGQAELNERIEAGQIDLRAGQAEIRKDLKSLEVRLAVIERRPSGPPAESGASAAGAAPTALLDRAPSASDGPRPPRTPLLQAGTVASQIGPMTAGGPNR